MQRSKIVFPPRPAEISHEQIEQGIARARYLRSKAYGDFFASVNRKIAVLGSATRRPTLSPLEPSSS